MGRLIDADEVKAKMESTLDMQDLYLPYRFYNILDETPIVDAVEVVRCKDCIHRMKGGMCEYKDYSVVAQDDNDFCSWGERRKDETD